VVHELEPKLIITIMHGQQHIYIYIYKKNHKICFALLSVCTVLNQQARTVAEFLDVIQIYILSFSFDDICTV